MLVSVRTKHLHALLRQISLMAALELTQQRREFNCPQRAYSGFPTSLGTETLYTGILVGLKDRFNASLSNAFGEIFHGYIAPDHLQATHSAILDFRFWISSIGIRDYGTD